MEMSQVINYCARDGHSPLPNPVRLESNGEIRSTMISPGAVDTELTDHISDKKTAENTEKTLWKRHRFRGYRSCHPLRG
jgi:NADP-dependent 3-hydroxy acid dehydrogenase YdfG